MQHWLMKSEPDEFGFDDLAQRKAQTEPWTGVRNYQARNHLRQMAPGDLAFFYHSSCAVPGIAGIVEITRAAFPDPTQFDPDSDYYDPKSDPAKPRWDAVNVTLKRALRRFVSLQELRAQSAALRGLLLLQPGSRLSVIPVSKPHWERILRLESRTGP